MSFVIGAGSSAFPAGHRAHGAGQEPKSKLVFRIGRRWRAEIAVEPFLGRVRDENLSIAEHDRIAIVTAVRGIVRIEARRRDRRQPVERDIGRIEPDRRVEAHDLPCRVTSELRRIDRDVAARMLRILAQLHHVADRMLVRALRGIEEELDEIRIRVERAVEVVLQLVPPDVVQRLLAGAVLKQLPRPEQIERERLHAGHVRRRDVARFGKHFAAVGGRYRIRAFAAVIECSVVGCRVAIVLLIAQEMIPARKHDAAETVDERPARARHRVLHEE